MVCYNECDNLISNLRLSHALGYAIPLLILAQLGELGVLLRFLDIYCD